MMTYLETPDKTWVRDIRQKIEDVLELVGDLVVHGQLPRGDSLQVLLHVRQLLVQTFQTHQLVCDSLAQGSNCCVLTEEIQSKCSRSHI